MSSAVAFHTNGQASRVPRLAPIGDRRGELGDVAEGSAAKALVGKFLRPGVRRAGVPESAVEGWLAFVRAACVKWVQSQTITRA
ncbi:hypothetical protein, partial [Mycobacterium colombiense]|uniref:hypothetical protein n=1 Tax=Mycobacterium colombiense TaxID=339268 RepID=UPI001C12A9A6